MEKFYESTDYIKNILRENGMNEIPKVAMILGSGLGSLAEEVENPIYIDYSNIPHFLNSEVVGHKNRLVIGKFSGKYVIIMQGRFHYYEGYTQEEITYPIKVFKCLGVKHLLITNAAGGCNSNFVPGDLMIIKDHINLSGSNPLIGKNEDCLGDRFPDMSEAYFKSGVNMLREAAEDENIDIKNGVYMYFSGPSYETPAEIKMALTLGADAVGMSTVPETIVANFCNIKVYGISCITNMAAGILNKKLDHKEVIEVTRQVEDKFSRLVRRFICNLKI